MKERKKKELIPVPGEPNVYYADEDTKIRYETTQKVFEILAALPPEFAQNASRAIRFNPEDPINEIKGWTAISHSGPVDFPPDFDPDSEEEPPYILVSKRSLQVLKTLGIQYQTVDLENT